MTSRGNRKAGCEEVYHSKCRAVLKLHQRVNAPLGSNKE